MNKSTNSRVQVKVKLNPECDDLVKRLDSLSTKLGIGRGELCEYLLSRAASRASFNRKSVTSRASVKMNNSVRKGIK